MKFCVTLILSIGMFFASALSASDIEGTVWVGMRKSQGSIDDVIRYEIKGFRGDMTQSEFRTLGKTFGGSFKEKKGAFGDSLSFAGSNLSVGGYPVDSIRHYREPHDECTRCSQPSKRNGPYDTVAQSVTLKFARKLNREEVQTLVGALGKKFDGQLETPNIFASRYSNSNADTGDIVDTYHEMRITDYSIELKYDVVKLLPAPTADMNDL